jgi:hypothetical protein
MRYEQTVEGGYPLSMEEYDALRQMMGAVSALDRDTLKSRCELIPEAWDKLVRARNDLMWILEQLFGTIPARKLLSIRRELQYTQCVVRIRPPSESDPKDHIYIDQHAFKRILERAIKMDCMFCDQTIKQCKRCQLYKDICDCFPYELSEPTDTLCPFAGIHKLEVST